MKVKIFLKSILMLAALTFLSGCSKSDDDESNTNGGPENGGTSGNREWVTMRGSGISLEVDFTGTDSRPDWVGPSPSTYENWMIYQVTLPYELRSWASEDDLMAVFISGEIRVAASPAISYTTGDSQTYYTYILKILGTPEKSIRQSFVYKYYCARLHRIFEIHDIGHFNPEDVVGVEDEYCLYSLAQESTIDMYPVHRFFELTLPDDLIPEDSRHEMYLAAFVGNECRGLTKINASQKTANLYVYGKSKDEQVTIYCIRDSFYTKLKPTISLNADLSAIVME